VTETVVTPITETLIVQSAPVTETIIQSAPVTTETVTTTTTTEVVATEVLGTQTTVGAPETRILESGTGLNPVDQYAIGSQYTAAGAYTATKPTELSVSPGDFLRLEETNADGWVKCTNVQSGTSGWVPLSSIKGSL
jgi:hypothetical protein